MQGLSFKKKERKARPEHFSKNGSKGNKYIIFIESKKCKGDFIIGMRNYAEIF
jgi:hypothetical protein